MTCPSSMMDENYVSCPNCENEQPDMGANVACENCGHCCMPFNNDDGELIED